MALSDLFDAFNKGQKAYFDAEHEANKRAEERLALMAGEQIYADDQYLKPSEMAERLSKNQYNTAVSRLGAARNKLNLDILNATLKTQRETGIADANNAKTRSTLITPEQYAKQIRELGIDNAILDKTAPAQIDTGVANAALELVDSQNKLGKAKVENDIQRLSYKDQVLTGVADNYRKKNESFIAGTEPAYLVDWIKKHPEENRKYLQNKADLATLATEQSRQAMESEQQRTRDAQAMRVIQGQIASGTPVEQAIASALNNPELHGGAVMLHQAVLEQKQQQQLEEMKQRITANSKSSVMNEQQQANFANIIADPVNSFQQMTGMPIKSSGDGSYLIGEGISQRTVTAGDLAWISAFSSGTVLNIDDLKKLKSTIDGKPTDMLGSIIRPAGGL